MNDAPVEVKMWTDMNLSKPGMLPSMELQRVGHDLATEQQQMRFFENIVSVLIAFILECLLSIEFLISF